MRLAAAFRRTAAQEDIPELFLYSQAMYRSSEAFLLGEPAPDTVVLYEKLGAMPNIDRRIASIGRGHVGCAAQAVEALAERGQADPPLADALMGELSNSGSASLTDRKRMGFQAALSMATGQQWEKPEEALKAIPTLATTEYPEPVAYAALALANEFGAVGELMDESFEAMAHVGDVLDPEYRLPHICAAFNRLACFENSGDEEYLSEAHERIAKAGELASSSATRPEFEQALESSEADEVAEAARACGAQVFTDYCERATAKLSAAKNEGIVSTSRFAELEPIQRDGKPFRSAALHMWRSTLGS